MSKPGPGGGGLRAAFDLRPPAPSDEGGATAIEYALSRA